MKFLADENVPQTIIHYLRTHGHDTVDVKRTAHRGEPDGKILAWSEAEDRIVITFDKDFVTPLYLPQNAAIIILHFPGVHPADILPKVEQLLPTLASKSLKRPYRMLLQKESLTVLLE